MTVIGAEGLSVISADIASFKDQLRRVYIEWCVSGPTLEASSALAAMAQEEAGHARVLKRLAGASSAPSDAEALLGKASIDDWPSLVGAAGAIEIALAAVLEGLARVEHPDFQRNLAKIAVEERYHADFFIGCFQELDGLDNEAGQVFASARTAAEERAATWLETSAALDVAIPVADGRSDAPVCDIACVHCGSAETRLLSAFGSSLLTSLMRCEACGSRFEGVRWR